MNVGVGTPESYSECFQWFIAPTNLAEPEPRPLQGAARHQQLVGLPARGGLHGPDDPPGRRREHPCGGDRGRRLGRKRRLLVRDRGGSAGDLRGVLLDRRDRQQRQHRGLLEPRAGDDRRQRPHETGRVRSGRRRPLERARRRLCELQRHEHGGTPHGRDHGPPALGLPRSHRRSRCDRAAPDLVRGSAHERRDLRRRSRQRDSQQHLWLGTRRRPRGDHDRELGSRDHPDRRSGPDARGRSGDVHADGHQPRPGHGLRRRGLGGPVAVRLGRLGDAEPGKLHAPRARNELRPGIDRQRRFGDGRRRRHAVGGRHADEQRRRRHVRAGHEFGQQQRARPDDRRRPVPSRRRRSGRPSRSRPRRPA